MPISKPTLAPACCCCTFGSSSLQCDQRRPRRLLGPRKGSLAVDAAPAHAREDLVKVGLGLGLGFIRLRLRLRLRLRVGVGVGLEHLADSAAQRGAWSQEDEDLWVPRLDGYLC